MSRPLTASSVLILENGDEIPFDEVSEKDRKQFNKNAGIRERNALTNYYSLHSEEFKRL